MSTGALVSPDPASVFLAAGGPSATGAPSAPSTTPAYLLCFICENGTGVFATDHDLLNAATACPFNRDLAAIDAALARAESISTKYRAQTLRALATIRTTAAASLAAPTPFTFTHTTSMPPTIPTPTPPTPPFTSGLTTGTISAPADFFTNLMASQNALMASQSAHMAANQEALLHALAKMQLTPPTAAAPASAPPATPARHAGRDEIGKRFPTVNIDCVNAILLHSAHISHFIRLGKDSQEDARSGHVRMAALGGEGSAVVVQTPAAGHIPDANALLKCIHFWAGIQASGWLFDHPTTPIPHPAAVYHFVGFLLKRLGHAKPGDNTFLSVRDYVYAVMPLALNDPHYDIGVPDTHLWTEFGMARPVITNTRPAPGAFRSSGNSSYACRNWNKNEPCANSPCTYTHKCSTCGGTHRAASCQAAGGAATRT